MQTATEGTKSGSTGVLPRTMQAAVYRAVNQVQVETVAVPEIGRGELLVRVATCGICGTDLKKIKTGSHAGPRIFGHETAGTIAAVGEGVRNYAVGERVMVYHHVPCGDCYYCRKQTYAQCQAYKHVGCTAGFEPSGGGFAEYVRVMDWIVRKGVVKIPSGVPFEQAAFIEPLNTCLKAVRSLKLSEDETVLVIGQGPIGIMLAMLAARTGAKVLTSDLYPSRHEVAAQFGLSHPIDASTEDVVAATRAASEGRGADAVILAVAADALIATAIEAARPGGRVLLFAQTQHGKVTIDPASVCVDEKRLMGSYSSSLDVQDEVEQIIFGGYRNGYDLTRLISHRYSLEDADQALRFAAEPHATSMKVMLSPSAEMADPN